MSDRALVTAGARGAARIGKGEPTVLDFSMHDWIAALERVTGKTGRRSGDEWRYPCPAHGGDGFNLAVVERGGKILTTCHSRDCKHEDIRAAIGLNGATATATLPCKGGVAVAVAEGAETCRYYYYTEAGDLYLTVCMWRDPVTGKKVGQVWREPKGIEGPYPLYNIRELADRPDAPVLIVEGERTADRAAEVFPDHVAVTSCGGAGKAKHTDWQPLAGREAAIWPDNDTEGRKHAATVHEHCREVCADIRIVKLPLALPDKWDLADPVPDGLDLRRILDDRPMLPVMRLDEMLAMSEPDIQWIVDWVLPAVGSSVLGGWKAIGKSTLLRNLVACRADGLPWLGHSTAPGNVIYLAHEDGFATVRRHFKALGIKHPERVTAMADRAPTHGDRLELLRNTMRAVRPALVIVDTLMRYIRIRDGNDYNETTAAIEPYVMLAREFECHLLLAAHSRKGGGDDGLEILGSTGITAFADTVLSLKKDKGRRMVYGFGRDNVQIERTYLDMDDDGRVTVAGTKHQADVRDTMTEVLDFVGESEPPVSGRDISGNVAGSNALVYEAIKNLVADGDLVRTGSGPRTKYATATATPLI